MRQYGWKPDLPDHRDLLYKTIKPRFDKFPDNVDLRELDSPIEDQGELGSCTANALAGALEFLELKNGKPLVDLSRIFLYFNERCLEGTVDQDSGAQIRDGIRSLAKLGICSEDIWPYNVNLFTQTPVPLAYADAVQRKIVSYHRLETLDDMLYCLADGYPFVFGFTVYDGFESQEVANHGVVDMPKKGEKSLGGHAVCAVGFDVPNKRFIVRNSWGVDWGNGGYFTIPFDYLEKLAEDFWTIRA